MSRIGKRELVIPAGVLVEVSGRDVNVTGPRGVLRRTFPEGITIEVRDGLLLTKRSSEERSIKQLHGTVNSLISSMIKGVSEGFLKRLLFEGVGYRASLKGDTLEILAGYSHPVLLKVPADLEVRLPRPVEVEVLGNDKQVVGQFAATVRSVRTPSPYSGKGISYHDERVRRKEVKKGTK